MKFVKITKKMLSDPEILLKKAGAVFERQAFPSHVYMGKKDYDKLKKTLKKIFKDQYPNIANKRIEMETGMVLLNLGPVVLKKGIQEGYLLVDDEKIQNEIYKKDNRKASST